MPEKIIISIEEAKKDKLFYFVCTAVVYRRSDGRCLILKRSEKEKVHPGMYSVPGGKLEWNDVSDISKAGIPENGVVAFENAIPDLIAREVKEEAGVNIKKDLHYLGSMVFIRPDGIPVVLLRFAAEYNSGDVKLEKDAFTDYAWVNKDELNKYKIIDTVKTEIEKAIELLDK